MNPKILAVIPARMASQRFPGKPLALIAGKPMIEHVVERCRQAQRPDHLLVATDSEEIIRACEKIGCEALLTSKDHPSGLDRVREVAERLKHYDFYLNVQGDEPLMAAETIDAVADGLLSGKCSIATAALPIDNLEDYENPNVVKVVLDHQNRALYFSRSPIPYFRNKNPNFRPLKHLGIYGYSRDILLKTRDLEPSPLEEIEGLEQLRFLCAGLAIQVVLVSHDSRGVDVPEDIGYVERLLEKIHGKTRI
ncbi:MAG: 3-deoxy-manno-octulosonate cytidylyltransferase [Leptospiraceae bacterium]|nr:3-deoxy-manno-octulosonate cytidylyltransferase [Leptospiraceae bacterium]MDW8306228.1 3-deoxy-manno-octulosonate cytidylyltransferase [Leptospiraceae bacterium]